MLRACDGTCARAGIVARLRRNLRAAGNVARLRRNLRAGRDCCAPTTELARGQGMLRVCEVLLMDIKNPFQLCLGEDFHISSWGSWIRTNE